MPVLKPVSLGNWDVRPNHPYGSHPDQVFDLMVPRGNTACPLIVLGHGGGGEGGTEDSQDMVAISSMLAMYGFAVASVRYRLSHQAKWPAQIQDYLAAIRELRYRAVSWRIYPHKFAGFGFSFGGFLVAQAAVAGEDAEYRVGRTLTQSHALACAVVDFPPTDWLTYVQTPGYEALREPTSWVSRLFGQPVLDIPDKADAASPALRVLENPNSAPMLIRLGTNDTVVPPDQGRQLHSGYAAAGIGPRCQLIEKVGAGHGTPAEAFYNGTELARVRDWIIPRLQ